MSQLETMQKQFQQKEEMQVKAQRMQEEEMQYKMEKQRQVFTK